ncbi:putative multidrug ABC transporter permease YbhS [bioreactor metagenome]|uniref:Putative multidrug ABC transporter permease YbhS n=1 Tax=bioreactor metagenome TaxID=1076179 RepID=A0A644ZN22_9ZZZZ
MNLHRLHTLIVKERKQLFRDPSSMVFGIVLPLILLLVFGYALSMDIRNIRLVIVEPQPSPLGNIIAARFAASEYFIAHTVRATEAGTAAVRDHRADACLYLPDNLERQYNLGDMSFLVVVNATNAMRARLMENYIKGVLVSGLARGDGPASPRIELNSRMWYNTANDSRLYMLPGVIVLIMTIIGTKLTAMIMAKEYEHGNLESMFVTPMTSGEILVAKALNNFLLGMIGLGLSLLLARFLFHVPVRGSLTILVLGSAIYLNMALALGLVISSITKNQFLASELSMIVSFMPVLLLSGFIYEISNMPRWVQMITYIIPARYYVDFLQTIFLVGNVWSNIVKNFLIIIAFTTVLMLVAKAKNPKSLEQ